MTYDSYLMLAYRAFDDGKVHFLMSFTISIYVLSNLFSWKVVREKAYDNYRIGDYNSG
jgi:hypothetical protein